jgi:hypothetical protein
MCNIIGVEIGKKCESRAGLFIPIMKQFRGDETHGFPEDLYIYLLKICSRLIRMNHV